MRSVFAEGSHCPQRVDSKGPPVHTTVHHAPHIHKCQGCPHPSDVGAAAVTVCPESEPQMPLNPNIERSRTAVNGSTILMLK